MILNPQMSVFRQAMSLGNNSAIGDRIGAFRSPAARAGQPLEQPIVNQIAGIARNPYAMPFDSSARGLRAISAAGGRARRAGGGGNAAITGGHGAAVLNRSYDETKQQLGDERIARILLPFLGQHNQAYGAALQDYMAQPKKKKKKSGLKKFVGTAADLALNYYSGGGWGAATGGGMSGQ